MAIVHQYCDHSIEEVGIWEPAYTVMENKNAKCLMVRGCFRFASCPYFAVHQLHCTSHMTCPRSQMAEENQHASGLVCPSTDLSRISCLCPSGVPAACFFSHWLPMGCVHAPACASSCPATRICRTSMPVMPDRLLRHGCRRR